MNNSAHVKLYGFCSNYIFLYNFIWPNVDEFEA